jgi:hypothetical protein
MQNPSRFVSLSSNGFLRIFPDEDSPSILAMGETKYLNFNRALGCFGQ